MNDAPLTFAIPKGRLEESTANLFVALGLPFSFESRQLITYDREQKFKFFLVKNVDLPTYVSHGIAGLGICGEDVLYESGHSFFKLHTFSFGSTRMCLAGKRGCAPRGDEKILTIATKFSRFTRDFYYTQGKAVQIIKLNGSVELAPVLGLAPYIVDLVETGSTLKANNLEVFDTLKEIKVHLVANPAYYKLHYDRINQLVDRLKRMSLA
ncbi:MAG TPA: ATP phosphoribosyltransferase [Spirochaetia bacterium]|nr:ATP phosphoribosyltransferase [Spirochaetia bacterium]